MEKDAEKQGVERAPLAARLFFRFLIYSALLVAIWRITSGSWGGWQGWVYIGLDVALGIMAALWVPLTEEMEQERTSIRRGVKAWDKWIVIPLSLWYPFGLLVLAGLDVRFDWSGVIPTSAVILAILLASAGRIFSTWAAASNPFYGRFVRIQSDRGHRVAEGGPYAIIRHPGYSGLLVFLLCSGIILGSWWTFSVNILMAGVLVLRTHLEDNTLLEELEGYSKYAARVKYRLIPWIW
jgi:protein-S-isoprenylcysteine O-methyltransferase Ste14